MIQGLRTAIYPVSDLAKGKAWFRQVVEREAYFDEPFYVGYGHSTRTLCSTGDMTVGCC